MHEHVCKYADSSGLDECAAQLQVVIALPQTYHHIMALTCSLPLTLSTHLQVSEALILVPVLPFQTSIATSVLYPLLSLHACVCLGKTSALQDGL